MPNVVEVVIRAKDATASALNKFKGGMAQVAKAVVAAAAAVTAFVYGLVKLGEQGAKVIGVKVAFARTTDDETAALLKLREASGGTISDLQLMQRHNQALALGTARSTDEFARMLRISDALGDSLGIDGVEAMEKFADVMASGSARAARALGIEIKAGATRNEILAAGEEVASRISGDMGEGAEAAERFATSVKNGKDRISELVAQSPFVAGFFGVLAKGVDLVVAGFEKMMKLLGQVPKKTWAQVWGAGSGGGSSAAAPFDSDGSPLPNSMGGSRSMAGTISPDAVAAWRQRQNPLAQMARRQFGNMLPEEMGITYRGRGVKDASLELENAAEVVVDSFGRMSEAAITESGNMTQAITASLQNIIANIKTSQGGLFGSTLLGGFLGVGIGLAGALIGRRNRDPVPVRVSSYDSQALAQMKESSGPMRITTIIEQGGVEIERIERDLYDRQRRDEIVRYGRDARSLRGS